LSVVVVVVELEPVPVVVSVVVEDEPDVAPGAGALGAGLVTEPEPVVVVVVVLDGDADGVRSGTGVSVVRLVRDSVHAVMVRPSARAQRPVAILFMVMSSLGGVRFVDEVGQIATPVPPRA
jgi:hypothetical protein